MTSYCDQIKLLSGAAIQTVNQGVSGEKCSDMLARFASSVLAFHPTVVVIGCGTNDVYTLDSTSEIISSIKSMAQLALAAGITPVLATIPPNNTSVYQSGISKLNAAIPQLAEQLGILWVDFYGVLVNPANNQYATGYGYSDGEHPTSAGERAMASALLTATKSLQYEWSPYIGRTSTDDGNLMPNPIFLTNTTGWSLFTSVGTTLTRTLGSGVAGGSNVPGYFASVTRTSASGASDNINLSRYITNFTAGDTLVLSGMIQTTGVEAGSCAFGLDFQIKNSGGTTIQAIYPVIGGGGAFYAADIPSATPFYARFVVAAGGVDLGGGLMINSGTRIVNLAQMTLVDQTTAGVR
jgi:lysophospholipase L1-like esterase